MNKESDIAAIRARLAELDAERASLTKQLERNQSPSAIAQSSPASSANLTARSPEQKKIALFRRLFAGRQDVFPVRWESTKTGRSGYTFACANEWKEGICQKPQIKCSQCPNRQYIPVSDQVIANHLLGKDPQRSRNPDFVAGVYPLLLEETCWFLAADFDGEQWSADALAYLETCRAKGVPAALERSRSGDGGHVWIFFSTPVPARDARQLGACLLTETLERRPEVGFASYDRFFPSQDKLPKGGFGNLIALPLQRRARDYGNSVFVDEKLHPYADQWAFLSSMAHMPPSAVYELIDIAQAQGRVLGVRIPIEDEESDEPWRLPPSRQQQPDPVKDPLPRRVKVVLADGIYIDRSALPPAMVARLVRLAAFQNPEFYRAQTLRLSTHDKPRIVSCATLHRRHVELPRGCLAEVLELLHSHGVGTDLKDERERGAELDRHFLGTLRPQQQRAVDALSREECGVLAATTAFGKTVVAAAMIARRRCNTLVLVHRKELLKQWVERLKQFLSVDAADIGTIGAGRRKPTHRIDVALIQSLIRKNKVSDSIAGYGQLIVDECHHLSAVSFEAVVQRSKARYVLGLSATVTRKDGHHPIIFMQCGPIRFRVDPRSQATQRGFAHTVRVRDTGFRLSPAFDADRAPIAGVYAALAQDEARNALIFDDVLKALQAGRSPLILTERRDHLELLKNRLKPFIQNLVVLHGGLNAAERSTAQIALQSTAAERLVLATGRYLGEGFDDARLDTLFLVMPISWKGTLAQYVGRLHRDHDGKREVIVYDYVDTSVPMLARMAVRRHRGYKALGYVLAS